MKELKKWMIGLDFTDHDSHLINYTKDLAKAFDPVEIVFVHIMKRNEIPVKFRKTEGPTREDLLIQMEKKVFSAFDEGKNIRCEVHEGTPYFDLWRETHLHHTDLFIVGEKDKQRGRNIVPEKFIKKSFCSVLYVPEVTTPLQTLWVPIDFSEGSKDALHAALQLAKSSTHTRVICHHIFEPPSLDIIEKDLQEEYLNYFRSIAEHKMNEFLVGIDEKEWIDTHFTPWMYAEIADHIIEEAEENGADLMVMSAGGKSRFSSIFLGSTTSEIIRLEKRIPLLILKKRIDKVKAWDILSNL